MKPNWKSRTLDLLHACGALGAVRLASRRWERRGRWQLQASSRWKCVVLCYHRIGSGGVPLYSNLAPESFEEQIRFVARHYRLISLEQMLKERGDPSARGQAVAITFDDGYRDVHTHAFPILRKFNAPATVYLTGRSIETGEVAWYDRVFLALHVAPGATFEAEIEGERINLTLGSAEQRVAMATLVNQRLRRVSEDARAEFCRELERRISLPASELRDRMLTWTQVNEMRKGGVSFGSHTMTHRVSSRLDDGALREELRECKELIQGRLGVEVSDFAYPFGQYADCGQKAEQFLAGLGYRSAALTVDGTVGPQTSPYRLRRFSMSDSMTIARFALLLTRAFLAPPAANAPMEAQVAAGENTNGERACATL